MTVKTEEYPFFNKTQEEPSVCPKCGSADYTVNENEMLGREIMFCDAPKCNTYYQIQYKLVEPKISVVLPRRVSSVIETGKYA